MSRQDEYVFKQLEEENARLREENDFLEKKLAEYEAGRPPNDQYLALMDENARLENELEVEVDAHARLASTNTRLREVEAAVREHLNNCIAGPRLRDALKETT